MKILLRLFSKESLITEFLRREQLSIVDTIEGKEIWTQVFSRTPILRDWLNRRELVLLKGLTLSSTDKTITMGQIAENRLYISFDTTPSGSMPKVVEEKKKNISEKSFLKKWSLYEKKDNKGKSK